MHVGESTLRKIWRLFPDRLRESLRVATPLVFLRGVMCRIRWLGASHDKIFDREYFSFVDKTTQASADAIAESVLADIRPSAVIDVGCGTGVLLERFRHAGIRVRGYERAEAALEFCRQRHLDVAPFNIVEDSPPPENDRFDVAICMEVGHQLAKQYADQLVGLLCNLSDITVFSSESPGGGDRYWRNEQPQSYWIEKFSRHGFELDQDLTDAWRQDWMRRKVATWFCRNVLLFRRRRETQR